MEQMRYWLAGTIAFGLLVFISLSSFGQEGVKPQKEGYLEAVIPEACRACHPALYLAFKRENPHWKLALDQNLPPDRKGCEACHGPGEKHAFGGGKVNLIFSFNLRDVRSRSDVCLKCHQKEQAFFQFRRGVHPLGSVSCNDCHRMHGSPLSEKLLKREETDLCLSCHVEVKSKFYLPTRHKVLEGAMKCTDCHTPHGTRTRASLRTWNKFNIDVCFKCHPEKRGPWAFEHPPLKFEGCPVCHVPHGSANRFLLAHRDVRRVCIQCHGQRHQNDFLFSTEICINCHTQIHGSNFSSRFFQ